MDGEEIYHPTCVQCGRPVRLEIAKTDEHGQAVHQECYELLLYGEQSTWPETYCKAMWEIENALVFGLIIEARAEISNRLFELNHLPGLHAKERLAISEAMVCLRSLEREDHRHKAAEIGKVVLEKVSSISAPQAAEHE
jgi:hypothetical protein